MDALDLDSGLLVDAAVYLRAAGHRVALFTAHHDHTRCFEETKDGSIDVRVYGDFIPLHLGQRLRAPCTIARACYLALRLATYKERFDIAFCDVIPHAIAALRLLTGAKIIFYCHFPDQLVADRCVTGDESRRLHGLRSFLRHERGSPRTRSAKMFFWISSVPPPMRPLGAPSTNSAQA